MRIKTVDLCFYYWAYPSHSAGVLNLREVTSFCPHLYQDWTLWPTSLRRRSSVTAPDTRTKRSWITSRMRSWRRTTRRLSLNQKQDTEVMFGQLLTRRKLLAVTPSLFWMRYIWITRDLRQKTEKLENWVQQRRLCSRRHQQGEGSWWTITRNIVSTLVNMKMKRFW